MKGVGEANNKSQSEGQVKTEPGAQRPPIPKKEKMPEVVSFDHGREIMDMMQYYHAHICKQLETICTELGKSPSVYFTSFSTISISQALSRGWDCYLNL